MGAYDTNVAAVQTSINSFAVQLEARLQAAKTADNSLKLEGLTLNEIVEMIAGTTGLTIQEVQDSLDAHIARTDNPHSVTKAQVGLGSVENFGVATNAEALLNTTSDKYIVPNVLWHVLDQFWADKVNGAPEALDTLGELATALQNNPDVITELTTLIGTKATPADIQAAVDGLTKANVGLDLVQNYGMATNAEAIAGVATDKYMSPASSKALVDDAAATLQAQIDAVSASVTKETVGLDLVENYAPATNAEAIAGVATNKYMTPASDAAALGATRTSMESDISAALVSLASSFDAATVTITEV